MVDLHSLHVKNVNKLSANDSARIACYCRASCKKECDVMYGLCSNIADVSLLCKIKHTKCSSDGFLFLPSLFAWKKNLLTNSIDE